MECAKSHGLNTVAPQAVAAILAEWKQQVYSGIATCRREPSPFAKFTSSGVNRAETGRVLACVRFAANVGDAWGYRWYLRTRLKAGLQRWSFAFRRFCRDRRRSLL